MWPFLIADIIVNNFLFLNHNISLFINEKYHNQNYLAGRPQH